MELKHFLMDAGVEDQRVDVREKCVEKVLAEAFLLLGIELSPAIEVRERRRKDLYFHSARLRS